ncbi:sugar kinase [Nonomuraea sp. LPB2021202275-12-8]|uniref:sugar kinase n=1 Tax=Nonomuraea sp. LPB2021202275-12-8 TaxID=3120159 RepID=UPI00300CC323
MTEVVTCGEAMLLVVSARARSFRRSIAGAEGKARLGHSVRRLGKVGADPAGESVLAELRAEGIDLSHAEVDSGRPTGLLVRDSHPARAIDVMYHRAGSAAANLASDWPASAVLSSARSLHLTGITPMLSEQAASATGRLLRLARQQGLTVSSDPDIRYKLGDAVRSRRVVGPLLSHADLLLSGADELEVLTGLPRAESVAFLLESGVGTVVVKSPDKSASAVTASGTWTRAAFDVPVTDPVGAGNAFAVGFLSATLCGLAPSQALTHGAAVAAMVVQSVTDVEGLPTSGQLSRFITGGEAVHR